MAEIKTFNADVSPQPVVPYGERRRREPDIGLQQAGHTLLQAGTTLAHVAVAERDYQEQQDVQGAYKDAAVWRQHALDKLDQMRQSGKPIGDDFNEYLTQSGDEYRQNRTTAKGQAVWDMHAANVYSDFGHTARMVDADIAGENAKNDATERINANGLMLQKDPTQLERVLQENHDSIMLLNIPVQAKQNLIRHLNNEAARNAAEGYIDANPYRAKEILAKQDHIASVSLTPELRTHLMDRADTKIRGIEADQMKARADADRQWHMQNQTVFTNAIVQMHQGKLTGDGIAKLAAQVDKATGRPVIDGPQAHELFNYLERVAREGPAKDDPSAVAEWAPKVYNNSASIGDVQRLMLDGQLSAGRGEHWIKTITDGTTVLKQMHSLALKSAGMSLGVMPGFEYISRPDQRKAFTNYTTWMSEQEQEYRKAGKPASDFYTSGEADAGLSKFMPATGVQSLEERKKELIDQHIPVQLPTGKWVTANKDGTFSEASAPGSVPPTPNGGPGVAPNPQFTGDQARASLDLAMRNTFKALEAEKDPKNREVLYKRYDDLKKKWDALPK